MCCHDENKDVKSSCAVFHLGNRIGLFFVFLSVLCFAWHMIFPVEQELQLAMLKMHFLWFSGMNAMSLFLALVQMYIFGYIVSGFWSLAGICGWCCSKCKCKKEV